MRQPVLGDQTAQLLDRERAARDALELVTQLVVERLVGRVGALARVDALERVGRARDALVALGALLAPHLGLAVLTAAKPSYQAGQSFSLRSRKPAAPKPAAAPAPAPAAWGAAAGDDAELMDEDDLLDEEDLKKKVAERSSCVDDVKAGRALLDKTLSPDKVGIFGLSYGGLNCLQALSRDPYAR